MAPHFDAHLTAEANEHLRQLDLLLGQDGEPDAAQMLRLAGALRQTARLADADTVAAVAERLEDTARSVIDRNVMWSGEIRWLAQQTVADVRLVLRALDHWGEDEEALMGRVLRRWDADARAAQPTDVLNASSSPDFDYRRRLAQAQAEGTRASEPIPSIAEFFYDDAGPHVLEDGSGHQDEGEAEPLPMLGALHEPAPADESAVAALSDSFAFPADDTEGGDEASATFEDARERFEEEHPKAEPRHESALVPIGKLLFRGQDALREARALEPQIRAALRGEDAGESDPDELIAELFDLLELASAPEQPVA